MPRHILTSEGRHPQHNKFVKKLLRELNSPGGAIQLFILEEHVAVTKSRHIHVIWDAWRYLSFEERAEIVLDAYGQAEGQSAEDIAVTGLTPEEAVGFGLLPYKVQAVRWRDGRGSPEVFQKAFDEEAARTLLGSRASQLRYARLEDAEQALPRLRQSLPGSSWVVVKEEPVES
jgi:hypothetical protein